MKPLAWFPLDADEWINRTALLSLEATGALFVAVLASWNATVRGGEPGTLPASDEALARLLGPTWRRVIAVVRAHFTEDPDDPTRLRCDWLAQLYAAQRAKHVSIVARAKKGGWPKGRQRHKPNTSAIPEVLLKQTEREEDPVGGFSEAPTTGGGDAAVGRGGATATPPPDRPAPPDPPPLTTESVHAWVEQVPHVRVAVEAAIESRLDEENRGWRERPAGSGLRNRLVDAALAEAYLRERRGGVSTELARTSHAHVNALRHGAAHA